jgi:hypothetical protein
LKQEAAFDHSTLHLDMSSGPEHYIKWRLVGLVERDWTKDGPKRRPKGEAATHRPTAQGGPSTALPCVLCAIRCDIVSSH